MAENNLEWRVLIPNENAIGAEFSDRQDAFFDLLENARAGDLIPDRSMVSALKRRIEVTFEVVVLGE